MKSHLMAAGVVLALTAGTLSTNGATNYWDNNGSATGFGSAAGNSYVGES